MAVQVESAKSPTETTAALIEPLIARPIANLKQGSSESVDSYGLSVTQAYARLLAEAKRTAPTNVSPYKHPCQTSLMATFENGLITPIRVELIREDPSLSYQASRTRAKKRETNALRGPPTPPPTTYASADTGASPGPDRQLTTSMANVEKAIVSNLTARRGRTQRVTFAKDTRGSADKRGGDSSHLAYLGSCSPVHHAHASRHDHLENPG